MKAAKILATGKKVLNHVLGHCIWILRSRYARFWYWMTQRVNSKRFERYYYNAAIASSLSGIEVDLRMLAMLETLEQSSKTEAAKKSVRENMEAEGRLVEKLRRKVAELR